MEKRRISPYELLSNIYYKLLWVGYRNISLDNEDLAKYVPIIEEIVDKQNLDLGDLFKLDPDSNSYKKYKDNLMSIFVHKKIGYFNEEDNSIELEYNPQKIINCLHDESELSIISAFICWRIMNAMETIKEKKLNKTIK